MQSTPVAIFDVDADLVRRLEAVLGPPIDSYLMGWQVWLVPVHDLAPDQAAGADVELEFRLHPPAGFEQPDGMSHHDLWNAVLAQLTSPRADGTLRLGTEQRPLDHVWTLLEVYPAFGEEVTPALVRGWAETLVGRPARGAGVIDHDRLGGRWKRRGPAFDLPAALRDEIGASPDPPADTPPGDR